MKRFILIMLTALLIFPLLACTTSPYSINDVTVITPGGGELTPGMLRQDVEALLGIGKASNMGILYDNGNLKLSYYRDTLQQITFSSTAYKTKAGVTVDTKPHDFREKYEITNLEGMPSVYLHNNNGIFVLIPSSSLKLSPFFSIRIFSDHDKNYCSIWGYNDWPTMKPEPDVPDTQYFYDFTDTMIEKHNLNLANNSRERNSLFVCTMYSYDPYSDTISSTLSISAVFSEEAVSIAILTDIYLSFIAEYPQEVNRVLFRANVDSVEKSLNGTKIEGGISWHYSWFEGGETKVGQPFTTQLVTPN